jgi:hypothetical protein
MTIRSCAGPPASVRVGWPAPLVTRPAATTARCSISVYPSLFTDLTLARGDGRYARILRSLAGVQLLILDDWGLEPLDAGARHDLYEILEDRYGRRSTILTSQIPVDKWHAVPADRRDPRSADEPPARGGFSRRRRTGLKFWYLVVYAAGSGASS